jgi:hypothetical protein
MNSKRNMWLAVTILLGLAMNLAGHRVSAQQADSLEVVRARFVGHYELVKYVSFRPDGETTPRDYVARIMYDPLGNMSAIGMPNDLPQRAEASGGERTIGGFAYFGKAEIDIAAGTVTHHVVGSPIRPELVGQGRVRHYEFDGDLLTLSIKDEEGQVTGQLTWRRVWSGK